MVKIQGNLLLKCRSPYPSPLDKEEEEIELKTSSLNKSEDEIRE